MIDKDLMLNISKESKNKIRNLNSGGCGLFACTIGEIFGYENFIPVALLDNETYSNSYFIRNRNELKNPCTHIFLYVKSEKKLFDSDGFSDLPTNEILTKLNDYSDYSNCHIFITWESLIEKTKNPLGWNFMFNRNSGSINLQSIIEKSALNLFNKSNLQSFMNEFRNSEF